MQFQWIHLQNTSTLKAPRTLLKRRQKNYKSQRIQALCYEVMSPSYFRIYKIELII